MPHTLFLLLPLLLLPLPLVLQPPKLDPVGETYLLPTTLRTLTRPDNTTLSDLAANMRTGATGQQRTAREAQKTLDALRKLPNLRRHRLSPHASHSKQPAVPNKAPGKEAPPAKTQRPPALHSRVPAQEVHAASADGGHYGGYGQPNSRVDLSFRGLNAFEQATANQGRQFEVVPPDQGLCVGGWAQRTVLSTPQHQQQQWASRKWMQPKSCSVLPCHLLWVEGWFFGG